MKLSTFLAEDKGNLAATRMGTCREWRTVPLTIRELPRRISGVQMLPSRIFLIIFKNLAFRRVVEALGYDKVTSGICTRVKLHPNALTLHASLLHFRATAERERERERDRRNPRSNQTVA